MGKQIFRAKALERLSSPEQLDLLMQVTSPKGWVALIALCAIVAFIIFWGIFGSLPTKVGGQGILMKTGGVLTVVPLSAGQVQDVQVRVGDIIQKGQVVARVDEREDERAPVAGAGRRSARGLSVAVAHRLSSAKASVGIAAALAPPALAPFLDRDGGDDERRHRIGPPEAEAAFSARPARTATER